MVDALERLSAAFGPGEAYRQLEEGETGQWRNLLPELLLDDWDQFGFRRFADGLFWWTDPVYMSPVLVDWPDIPGRFVPFARSAWGNLFLWGDGGLHFLDVHHGELISTSVDLELALNHWLPDEETQEEILSRAEFTLVKARIGPPEWDEMYGYEPALALGGSGDLSTVRRYKIREHLSILGQLHGGA